MHACAARCFSIGIVSISNNETLFRVDTKKRRCKQITFRRRLECVQRSALPTRNHDIEEILRTECRKLAPRRIIAYECRSAASCAKCVNLLQELSIAKQTKPLRGTLKHPELHHALDRFRAPIESLCRCLDLASIRRERWRRGRDRNERILKNVLHTLLFRCCIAQTLMHFSELPQNRNGRPSSGNEKLEAHEELHAARGIQRSVEVEEPSTIGSIELRERHDAHSVPTAPRLGSENPRQTSIFRKWISPSSPFPR